MGYTFRTDRTLYGPGRRTKVEEGGRVGRMRGFRPMHIMGEGVPHGEMVRTRAQWQEPMECFLGTVSISFWLNQKCVCVCVCPLMQVCP